MFNIELLFKSTKDTFLLDSYRPVSLLNSIDKVFEEVVFSSFLSDMFSKNMLYLNQYKFRIGFFSEGTVLETLSN